MDKNEILERSREEKVDEGMVAAVNAGSRTGFVAFAVMYVFLVGYNVLLGHSRTLSALNALFLVSLAGQIYEKYRFSRENRHLVASIVCGGASLVALLAHVITR